VIKTFLHDGLRELWETGKSRKVRPDLHKRAAIVLDLLHQAEALHDLSAPFLHTHPLKGLDRYSLRVSGAWRITFEWRAPDAYRVDLEQYH
jgi:toxin HigB-1